MTQKEFFKKCNTDHLLSMRYQLSCHYPINEGDKYDYSNDMMWDIDKKLLYSELARRPHRVRAKNRRKSKFNK